MKSQKITTEEKILTQSIQLIEKYGIQKFSMRGLAKALQLDPMAVYHYYASKEELIFSCIQKIFNDFDLLGEKSFISHKTTNPHLKKSDRKNFQKDLKGRMLSYRKVFLQFPNSCLYLLSHGYEEIPKLEEYNSALVKMIFEWEKDPKKSELIRDILIDYLHGYSLATITSQSRSKRKQKEMELKLESSLDFLIERLVS